MVSTESEDLGTERPWARRSESSRAGAPPETPLFIRTDRFQRYFFPVESNRFLARTVPVCVAALVTFLGFAAYYGKLIEPGTLGFFASINFRFPLITLLFAFAVHYYMGRYNRSLMAFLENASRGNEAERQRRIARLQAIGHGETRAGFWLRPFRWVLYAGATAGWFYLYVYRPLFTDFALGDWENPNHPLAFIGFAGWYFVLSLPILAAALNALVTGLYVVVRAADGPERSGVRMRGGDAGSYLRGFRSLGDAVWVSSLVLVLFLLYLIPSVLLYRSDRALLAIVAYSLAVGVLVTVPLSRLHRRMVDIRRRAAGPAEAGDGGTTSASLRNSGAPEDFTAADVDRTVMSAPSWPLTPARLGALVGSFLIPAVVALALFLL